jgi:ribosomal protein L40E
MRDFCASCGTAIDGTHQYCAHCGVFLAWKTWAPPLDAQICRSCEAPNAPGRTSCGHCFKALGPGQDAAYCGQVYAFEHLPPAGPGLEIGPPRADGGCRSCGTINEPGAAFCASCGHFLEWDTPAAPGSPTPDGPEVPA